MSPAPCPPADELRRIRIFSLLPAEDIERVAAAGEFAEIPPQSEILTPDGTIIVIKEGTVHCYILDASDKRILLGISGPGDVLGELSYLCREGSNDQKVELLASTAVSCFRLSADVFFDVISGDPAANIYLNRLLARRLAEMNAFAKQVVDINIDPASLPGRTIGEKTADRLSAWIGSWYFLGGGAIFTALWMLANSIAWIRHHDPYPFIFLNLIFSVISGATMPVLLISQNRQNQLDRMASRVNHQFTLRSNQILADLAQRIGDLETRTGPGTPGSPGC